MNYHDPDANPLLDTIASRAHESIGLWLMESESALDTQFGAGCAEKHPGAAASLVNACASVYLAHLLAEAIKRSAPI